MTTDVSGAFMSPVVALFSGSMDIYIFFFLLSVCVCVNPPVEKNLNVKIHLQL